MRILYLSQLIPYPIDAGPKVRIYHVLQYLAAAGHEVTLVAFRRPNDKEEHIALLRGICRDVHTVLMQRSRMRDAWHLARTLPTGRPFLIGRDDIKEMHRLVNELVSRDHFDAVHADQLWMAQYALAAKENSRTNRHLQLTLDQHNAVHLIPQRLAAETTNPLKQAILSLESRNLSRYEIETCRQFDRVVWVTDEDRQAVARHSTNNRRWSSGAASDLVIPICVDPEDKPVIRRKPEARHVTFLGGLHWPPNAEGVAWFIREVWPAVRQQVPDALLTVIGKDPSRDLILAGQASPDVDVCGYVNDPLPYLAETAAFIVPLHAGGGMRVKIIDAWSWGLPVISTTIGAEGIHYRDGKNVIIADNADTFAQAVIRLLREPELAEQLGMCGRQTVETEYAWQRIYGAWDQVFSRKPAATEPTAGQPLSPVRHPVFIDT